ncbi:glycosyltransferase family 4 protein [Georgenia daeguensis]|uniref:Glycosyltransferase family 4 protein n=1 Tax=Georgenia daeguensis TaxID=908355 RepID=A0ABP8EUB0_9MICO
MDTLRIAMVAPPFFELPPTGYGGIELVVADLIDTLVERGHEVTLIGAGRNGTRAQFRRTYAEPQHARLGEPLPEAVHAAAAAQILDRLDVDVIHDHTLLGPLQARGRVTPTVVTVHGPVVGEPAVYYRLVGGTTHLVAISHAQRSFAPQLSWVGTVHNAIDPGRCTFRAEKEDWVLFLGRCTPDKGMHLAIDVARAAGRPIKLAAKCQEPPEQAYFEAEIRPRLGDGVEWLGEITGQEKQDALAAARCLLFPLQWEEPFGMVLVESLASGTPVVTMPRGAVPEIVTDGVTGFVRDRLEDLPAAIDAAGGIDPHRCRQEVLDRFTPQVMATRYEKVYRRVLDRTGGVARKVAVRAIRGRVAGAPDAVTAIAGKALGAPASGAVATAVPDTPLPGGAGTALPGAVGSPRPGAVGTPRTGPASAYPPAS